MEIGKPVYFIMMKNISRYNDNKKSIWKNVLIECDSLISSKLKYISNDKICGAVERLSLLPNNIQQFFIRTLW